MAPVRDGGLFAARALRRRHLLDGHDLVLPGHLDPLVGADAGLWGVSLVQFEFEIKFGKFSQNSVPYPVKL